MIIKSEYQIDGVKFPHKIDFNLKAQLDVYAKNSRKDLIVSN